MKQTMTLNELATSVTKQRSFREDFLVSGASVQMEDDTTLTMRLNGDKRNYSCTDVFHRQASGKLNIPIKYYRRMLGDAPDLLAQNVNRWLDRESDAKCLRTFKAGFSESTPEQGTARAFLGKSYRPLDNYDLLENILPKLDKEGYDLKTCDISESFLYVHAVFPKIQGEVKKGDVVQAGVQIRNSEVGMGSFQVNPWINRLVCNNGMTIADAGVRKYHAGKRLTNEYEVDSEIFSEGTRRQTDKAFWMQVNDLVDTVLSEEKFEYVLNKYREVAGIEIPKPVEAVELIADKFVVNQEESDGILAHLTKGGDLSQWGLANAVTTLAHDVEDYQRAVELEAIGGQVIELPKHTWLN